MVLDVNQLSKAVAKRKEELKFSAKDMICPIILGCHDDGESEAEMDKLVVAFHGTKDNPEFTSAIRLKDFLSEPPHNENFRCLLQELEDQGITACLVFYIHPSINIGKGKGMISEFLQVLYEFSHLRHFGMVLKYKEADFIEQLDLFHHKDIFEINSVEEAIEKAIPHLKGHLEFIKHKITQNTPKKLNNSKPIHNQKEVKK